MKMPLPPVISSDTSAAGPAGLSRTVAVGVDVGVDGGGGVSVARAVAVAVAVGVSDSVEVTVAVGASVAAAVGVCDSVEVTVAVGVSVAAFPPFDPSEHAETSAHNAPGTTRNAALQCTLFALLDGYRFGLISFR
jgi:hypothetical protein